jgi:hypothetical protein
MARRSRLVRVAAGAATVAVGVLASAPESRAADWRWPVRGPLIGTFQVTSDPFGPGQHRGIDIAAPAGATVRSACGGRVKFAGFVPTAGRTVTVRCGGLAASYLHLSRVHVRRGQRVAAGSQLGTVGSSGAPRSPRPHLHFGVRVAGRRWAYVDPLLLLGDLGAPDGPPVVPAARPGAPGPLGPAPRPLPRAVRPAPVGAVASPAGRPLPARVLPAAWLGLGLLVIASVKHLVPHRVPDPSTSRKGPPSSLRARWASTSPRRSIT